MFSRKIKESPLVYHSCFLCLKVFRVGMKVASEQTECLPTLLAAIGIFGSLVKTLDVKFFFWWSTTFKFCPGLVPLPDSCPSPWCKGLYRSQRCSSAVFINCCIKIDVIHLNYFKNRIFPMVMLGFLAIKVRASHVNSIVVKPISHSSINLIIGINWAISLSNIMCSVVDNRVLLATKNK